MKLDKLFQSLLLTGVVVIFLNTRAKGEQVQKDGIGKSSVLTFSSRKPRLGQPQVPNSLQTKKSDEPSKNIPRLSEIKHFLKSADVLVQAPAPTNPPNSEQRSGDQVVPITGVKANSTAKGVEVILQTTQGEQLQVTNRSTGNNFIVDISGGQLRLPSGEAFTFRSEKPLAEVSEITVTNIDANTVRVTVVGEKALPTVELFDDSNGLIFAVASATSSTAPQQQPETQQQQPTSETPQEQPSASTDEPIELVVTGEEDGYFVPNATTGTRTDTPIRDIPFSIQVVPQQILKDQQVQRVSDALRNVPGVQSDFSPRSIFEFYTIRGFGGFSRNIAVNGLQEGQFAGVPLGVGNIERIEVLKGPGGALFSQGTPGGTINVITKQPSSTPFYNVEASFGSFNTYSGLIDLSGPLDEKKNVLYRFNAYGFSSDTFVDKFDIKRYSFAPAISLRLGENTQLTLQAEYNTFEQPNDRGLPAQGTVLPNRNGKLPISRYLGEPSIDSVELSTTRIGYNLEHRFDKNWQIRNAFRASYRKQPQNSLFYDELQEDQRTLNRALIIARDQEGENYILNTDVVGDFKTGSINHKLLLGFDLSTNSDRPGTYRERSLSPIDIFNPVYSRNNAGPVIDEFTPSSTVTDVYGIYLQDQITLVDNLKLLLGGRFDWVEQRLKDGSGAVTSSQNNSAFSPRVGIVYQPIAPISVYASYSRSFRQVIGTAFDESLFEPERSTQYEVGVKADLSDRLAATLAYFDITRSNVLTDDPNDASGRFSIQTGEQKSQGIELEITGEILPGWKIVAGYAYTDARVTQDTNPNLQDNQLNNSAKHGFNLWTTYEIQRGSLQGLGFGLGMFYVGERQGNLSNTFTLPSYLRTDAAVFYNQGPFRAAVNIKNLFDIRYFETASNILSVFPGEPLTVVGSVSWRF
ncbi:MAG: TonB-dependent receptor [Spirirestis rafaelensis WJT71-NPBG6]|jgi:iron complex outermembrane receptor protein|nr:TonB-dependent receptor [Spirirestis rafaelensis WJT71-NPBG6]